MKYSLYLQQGEHSCKSLYEKGTELTSIQS